MTRIIQQITQQLIDRLPDNDQYYRLDELRSWGFPSFIVKRIKIELERNLAESMIPPKTDWANIQSDTVQFAWQKFVDAIRAEARLPASYAKTVIETAVADVIEMLIQPRKNIPEVIFGSEKKLSYDQVEDRTKAVVVYRHFATLVPRFMQKKELEKLSKERCAKIIKKADEKLTARYSPLNWAQMLEPLFNLLEGGVDTNLFRLFFEDKDMPRIAREFDLMNDTLTRAQFIEVLSSPDLLDFEGYEDDQSSLFDNQQKSESVSKDEPEKKESDESPVDEIPETDSKTETEAATESKTEKETETPPSDDENDINDLFPDKDEISALLFPEEKKKDDPKPQKSEKKKSADTSGKKDSDSQSKNGEGNSLNAIFSDQEEEEPEEINTQSKKGTDEADEPDSKSDNKDGNEDKNVPFFVHKSEENKSDSKSNSGFPRLGDLESYLDKQEDISEFNDEDSVSINAAFSDQDEQKEDDEPKSNQKETEETEIEDKTQSDRSGSKTRAKKDAAKTESPLEDESGETPMWMRFMSEEEIEEYKKQELEKPEVEESEADDDGFIDDPIIDLTNEEASDEEIQELNNLLSDDRDMFVEEIFRGSDRAFDEAVEDIATYENWHNASKYIQKDIFKRNLVDMYSEEAVDFTDRLQSYFLEKQKSK